MSTRDDISDWFTEQLSDEAAHEILSFLEEFTAAFGHHYYGEIHRHLASTRQELQLEFRLDESTSETDDTIPF